LTNDGRLDAAAFGRLMDGLAAAWNAGDADGAAASFAEDAVYLEPPAGSSTAAAPSFATSSSGRRSEPR